MCHVTQLHKHALLPWAAKHYLAKCFVQSVHNMQHSAQLQHALPVCPAHLCFAKLVAANATALQYALSNGPEQYIAHSKGFGCKATIKLYQQPAVPSSLYNRCLVRSNNSLQCAAADACLTM